MICACGGSGVKIKLSETRTCAASDADNVRCVKKVIPSLQQVSSYIQQVCFYQGIISYYSLLILRLIDENCIWKKLHKIHEQHVKHEIQSTTAQNNFSAYFLLDLGGLEPSNTHTHLFFQRLKAIFEYL